jgi:hypothetical protein
MKTEDLKGMIYAVADHSHTDRIKTQRVITRYQDSTGNDEWDASSLQTYAKMAAEEMREQKGAKTRHAHKRVFIVKILEVFDVMEEDQ